MAKLTLAQIAYLSQDLTDHFKDLKHAVFKTSLELEMTQAALKSLIETYDQWIQEGGLNHEGQ